MGGIGNPPVPWDPYMYVISSTTERGGIYANLAKIAQTLCEESANLAKLAKLPKLPRNPSANPLRNFAK